ncbi:MAG: hypothetical protein ACI9K2_005668 [Myxococcota bacterium]|jgi:hypothetical protein
MRSSDPMGDTPGRVLLNGNAETLDRFVHLALEAVPEPVHRSARVRAAKQVCVCTAAWGPGEANDAPVRRAFEAQGWSADNLQLNQSVRTMLDRRDAVNALYEEHRAVWWELWHTYIAENDTRIAGLRDAWARAQTHLENPSMVRFLADHALQPPGPRTRPVAQLLEAAYGDRIHRALTGLQETDARRSLALHDLWDHFHVAAGLEFDPLWQKLRSDLVERLLGASLVALPGGSPSRLLVGFRFFRLTGVLTEALRRGTCFFGTSAGAMALGRRVVVFHDKSEPRSEFQLLENGVGLVEGLQVFPHCTDRVQTQDPANLAYLAARFSRRVCVGLNAGSVLDLRPIGGAWEARSAGEEAVVVFGRRGQSMRVEPGAMMPTLAEEAE